MIKIRKLYGASCDRCCREFEIEDGVASCTETKEELIKQLHDSGWRIKGKGVICPECLAKGVQP